MRFLICIICFLFPLLGQSLSLRPDAPERYVVQPGDSLWDIACRYLAHPWEWQELWHANPQIHNPNRLYPGAVIALRYRQKKPYLTVLTNGTVKLSPYMREMQPERAIPSIPLGDIKPFLDGSLILDHDILANAPAVVAFMTEHMLGGQGDEVYVKNLCPVPPSTPGTTFSYAIYRRCSSYHDPVTQKLLGYKATLVGYAELLAGGDPARIILTDIKYGVRLRDRVLPNNHPDFDIYFEPRTPVVRVKGLIIDLLDNFTQGAEGLVAVINRGKDAGLQPGDVLGVYSKPRPVRDMLYRYSKNGPCKFPCVKVPPERIGEILIFRTFTHTSVALVVRSTRAITFSDIVKNP